jgi:hypothetical protein
MTDDERIQDCQKEIQRLRGVIRERENAIEIDIDGDFRSIGDVMEEAWARASGVNADRFFFHFDGHKIIIEKE